MKQKQEVAVLCKEVSQSENLHMSLSVKKRAEENLHITQGI